MTMALRNRIAITGVSGNVAQGIIKGLRQAPSPYYLVGLDYSETCAGYFLVDAWERMPPVRSLEYVPCMIEVLRRFEIDLLLLGIDSEISVISGRCGEIERETGCKVVISEQSLIVACTDKLETARLFEQLYLPFLKTLECPVSVDEVLSFVELPVIVKPRRGHGSKGLLMIDRPNDLRQCAELRDPSYCVQAYVEGREYTAGLLFDEQHGLRDYICFERRLVDGTTMDATVVDLPGVNRFIEDFGARFPGTGPVNLQFRLDADGIPRVFEINPRFSGTTGLRVACGFNGPLRIAEHFLKGRPIERAEVEPVRVYRIFSELVVPQERVDDE
ncbi:ATP-grasp domain-containing protein [Sulfidibacter corallicola]